MNLQKLEYFIYVAECLNFTEAAKKLYITQPSLSRQIAELEEELGIRLFIRTRRSVTLTKEGAEFLPEAREILSHQNELITRARRLHSGFAGKLEVGYSGVLDNDIVPEILKLASEKYPNLDISLRRMNLGKLTQSLKEGPLDVCFATENSVAHEEKIKWERITKRSLELVVPQDHPFASYEKVELEQLKDVPFLMMERYESPATHDAFLSMCNSHNITLNIVQYCNDPQTMIMYIVGKKGVGLMVPSLKFFSIYGLKTVPLNFPLDEIEEHIVVAWNAGNDGKTTKTFIELVKDFARGQDAEFL